MTGKMLGSGLGVIAMLMTLIWALGAGLDIVPALMRSLAALLIMFFVGLILGRAMADSVAPGAPKREELPPEKDKLQKKGP